ncbi:MAG TPA: APC family permease [Coleofasciculaceae cyanobacterium]
MSPKLTPELLPKRSSSSNLPHSFGVLDLTLLGLSSVLGTGVFVGIGIAVQVADSGAIAAIALAALLALWSELSAAQLWINRSAVSGTYEYGYHYLSPWLGFTAGWAFLLAKIASAATAALGCAEYLLSALGQTEVLWLIPIALGLVALLTLILLRGLHQAGFSNQLIVLVTLVSLLFFIGTALRQHSAFLLPPTAKPPIASLLQATALMFVAYLGYGRMAYLGNAVRQPRRSIPQAIVLTLLVALVLYLGVVIAGISSLGVQGFGETVNTYLAPLSRGVQKLSIAGGVQIVAVGAIVAMLTVLLNLMLDCMQMLQSMAEQQDIPWRFARFNATGTTPTVAVITVGSAIACLIWIGDVRITWSFSAFSALIYYAITHWAVLKLSPQERLYPRLFTQLGLGVCLFLAFWVNWRIWLVSLGLLVVGLIWRGINQWVNEQSRE